MSASMTCPHCGSTDSSVKNSRPRGQEREHAKAVPAIVRRRECFGCGKRYSTVEITVEYLDTLENWRASGSINELMKAKSALGTAIDVLTNVGKVKGGLPL